MLSGLEGRAARIAKLPAQLVAEVTIYETSAGGPKQALPPGFGCPYFPLKDLSEGWDGWMQLTEPLAPGEARRVGFVFLSGESAASSLRRAGRFYLWIGRIIGEAVVVDDEKAPRVGAQG